MEKKASVSLSPKKIGNCQITWSIENFYLQWSDTNPIIQSLEFSINIPEQTLWSLVLRPQSSSKYFASLCLKRSLVDSGPPLVWINLRTYSSLFIEGNTELLFSLEKGSEYEIVSSNLKLPFSEELASDDVEIDCGMIVYSKDTVKQIKSCQDEGLKILSGNLLDLYIFGKNFDIELLFNGNVIKAHKVVLYTRNAVLRSLITRAEEQLENEVLEDVVLFEFSDAFDYNAMNKILAYLYSGDMSHVFEEPSHNIHDCAMYLEITEINDCYEPDVLILTSSVELQELRFIISNFSLDYEICRLEFDDTDSFTKCRICLYGTSHNTNCVSVFTESFESPVSACLEISLKDMEDHNISTTRIANCRQFSSHKIIRINSKNQESNGSTFKLNMHVKLYTDKKYSYILKQSTYVNSIDDNFYYQRLSADMEEMFDMVPYLDASIYSNDIYFLAHKCILGCRSKYFSDIIETLENGENIILNIDPVTLEIALKYIYNGRLSDVEDEDFVQCYKAAVALNLPLLKTMCSNKLQVSLKINHTIACSVIKIAEVHEDKELKECALHIIFSKKLSPPTSYGLALQDVYTCNYC